MGKIKRECWLPLERMDGVVIGRGHGCWVMSYVFSCLLHGCVDDCALLCMYLTLQ